MNDQQPNDFQPQPLNNGDNTASYSKRFLAAAIDFVLMAILLMFFMRFLGLEPTHATDVQAAQTELIDKLAGLSEQSKMLLTFSPFIIFFLLHGFLLYQYGQTIGKRMVGIAIVSLDNQKMAFMPLIAQRYFSQWLMGMVPVVGIILRLVDVLLIFRSDKRCLHDFIARTKVIDLRIAVTMVPNNSFIA